MEILNVHGIGVNFYAQMIVFLQWFEDERCFICVSMSPMDLAKLVLLC